MAIHHIYIKLYIYIHLCLYIFIFILMCWCIYLFTKGYDNVTPRSCLAWFWKAFTIVNAVSKKSCLSYACTKLSEGMRSVFHRPVLCFIQDDDLIALKGLFLKRRAQLEELPQWRSQEGAQQIGGYQNRQKNKHKFIWNHMVSSFLAIILPILYGKWQVPSGTLVIWHRMLMNYHAPFSSMNYHVRI